MSDKPQRRFHSKTRNGCRACKQRHVRCDTQRPSCSSCVRRQEACHYPPGASGPSPSADSRGTRAIPHICDIVGQAESKYGALIEDSNASGTKKAVSKYTGRYNHTELTFSTASLDAYGMATSMAMSTESREKLQFYCKVRSPVIFRSPVVVEEWSSLVVQRGMNEPGLLHAVLGIVTKTIKQRRSPSVIDYGSDEAWHKGLAITHVNRKLRCLDAATDLTTLMTVSVLLGFEVGPSISLGSCYAQGRDLAFLYRMRCPKLISSQLSVAHNDEAILIHLTGMKDLIELRGGWGDVPPAVLLTATVADFCLALAQRRAPIFPEITTPQHLVPRYEQYLANCLIPAEFQPLGMALLKDPRYRTYLSQDSLQLYNDIRRLMIWQSVHMRQPYTYPLWRDDHDFTVILVAQTMTRLATIVPEHRLQNISAIETLCDTVMQFFVVESQGAVWRQTTIAPKIVALLRELLSCPDDSEQCCTVQDASQRVVGFDLAPLWAEYPELVIWSFLYGAYAIVGDQVQQTWFLYHCAKGIVRHHDPSIETWSWDTLVNGLQGFFYLRHLHDPEFSALWRRCKDLVPSAIDARN